MSQMRGRVTRCRCHCTGINVCACCIKCTHASGLVLFCFTYLLRMCTDTSQAKRVDGVNVILRGLCKECSATATAWIVSLQLFLPLSLLSQGLGPMTTYLLTSQAPPPSPDLRLMKMMPTRLSIESPYSTGRRGNRHSINCSRPSPHQSTVHF